MPQNFGNAFLKKPPHKDGAVIPQTPPAPAVRTAAAHKPPAPRQVYSKVFRWRPPKGHPPMPATVEIVGGFTHWQKVPLLRDSAQDTWHVTLNNLQCGRMHHYMLLVDGQPVRDKHCDGMAVPHGPQEEQYQLMTDRGPRVLMLFAQSK
jgi:hypothetical protein